MGFVISLFSGFALTGAYAPFGFFPVAVMVGFLSMWVWRRYPPQQAFWYGYLFGVAHFGSSVYWVYHSLHDFGAAEPLFAAGATFLFVATLGLYFALLALVASWSATKVSLVRFYCLLFPSLWVLCEWLRSTLFSGFAWNLIGQSLIDSPFSGIFAWVGILGASWFVVFLGGLVATIIFSKKIQPRVCSAFVFLFVLVLGWSSSMVQWTDPVGEKISVGIVQSGVSQDVKFNRAAFMGVIQTYRELTMELLESDLVVWPETSIPAYYDQVDDQVMLPLYEQISSRNGGNFLAGIFFHDNLKQQRYNSLVKVGVSPEVYHKRHLVPFGEYIPLRYLFEIFTDYVTMPMSDLDAGNQRNLLTVGNHRVGVSICYEVTFGREVIESLPEAAYLVNVSNDSWFGDSIAPNQHLQMAQVRAAETGRPMVRATSTGISALIDYQGKIVRRSDQFVAQNLVGYVQPRQGMTPYARFGDEWVLAYIIVLWAIGFLLPAIKIKKEL